MVSSGTTQGCFHPTSNKPRMKEHCNLLIHVIQDIIITWKKAWIWRRDGTWRKNHCLKRKSKRNKRRKLKWKRKELEKMETLKMRRERRKTTWRKKQRKSWRWEKILSPHKPYQTLQTLKNNNCFWGNPCSFQKFVWSPLFGNWSQFQVW